jgi:hypothetical protein
MAAAPIYTGTINTTGSTFVNADSTNSKTIFTPGSLGSRIHAIMLSSDDSVEHYVTFSIEQSATVYTLGTAYVAAKPSSTYSHSHTNVLDPELWTWLDANNIALYLPAGTVLKLAMDVAVTSSQEVHCVVFGGDY